MNSSIIGINEIIAIFANIFEAIGNFPLFMSIYKNKENDNFSISFCTIRLISSILWIIYGIQAKLFLVTFSNYFSVLCSFILIFCKLNYNKPKCLIDSINYNSNDSLIGSFDDDLIDGFNDKYII